MSGTDAALIITAFGTFISAVASSIAVVMGAINARKLNAVHDLTNSKMSELLEVTKTAAEARGLKLGQEEKRTPY